MIQRGAALIEERVGFNPLGIIRTLWNNPLLVHARRAKQLPMQTLRIVLPAAAGGSLFLVLLAWVLRIRPLGALLTALSLGAVLLPVFFAGVAGADRITRQMRFSKQDPRRLTDLPPEDVTVGLALVTLWRLRWPIIIAMALTPALMISVLRLDIISINTWRTSAEVLGSSTAGAQAGAGIQDGLPWVRLLIRMFAAGIIPWAALGTFCMMGVTTALALREASLSPLTALLITVISGLVMFMLFNLITWGWAASGIIATFIRLVFVSGLTGGLVFATVKLNQVNAQLFVNPPELLNRKKGTS